MTLIPVSFVLALLAAAALAMLRSVLPRAVSDALSIGAAATTSALLLYLTIATFQHGSMVYWFGQWTPHHGIAIGIDFVVDPFSATIASLASILTTASLCFGWKYFEALGTLFPTLMLVFLAAMIGYCFSGDLFTVFVFFELMSTVAYALTGYKIEADSLEGALTFAIVNSLGALLFLWGIGLLYGEFGALNLAQLGTAMAQAGRPGALTIMALALLTTGFLTKAVAVPFHFWHAEADAVAPIPICVLISGILAPLGLYGLGRIYWSVFAGSFAATGGVWTFLLGLGGLTALVGAIMAIRQRQLKRLLAFSTISHIGMALCGLATGLAVGVGGALIYLVGHALVKAALFLAIGVVLHRLESVDRPELHGRGRGMVWTACLLVVGGLGLAGVPPFATFTGKALMETAAQHAGASWVPYLFTLTSGLTGGVVLRVTASIFLGWGPADDTEDDAPTNDEALETRSGYQTPLSMIVTPTVLLLLAAGLGLAPYLSHAAQVAAASFIDASGYRMMVLHGRPLGEPLSFAGASPYNGIDAASLLSASAALGIALIVAAISLFGHKAPQLIRKFGVGAIRPLAGLERLHNGDIRDYVTWLVFGATMLAAAFVAIVASG
jgi:multicomponent Na+:H+ antiporter subunit D